MTNLIFCLVKNKNIQVVNRHPLRDILSDCFIHSPDEIQGALMEIAKYVHDEAKLESRR
ncbi:hypothetical protein SB6421_00223 [Klebsiella huaxiensis]|nr:hypothetical protein SB6421_00223 [Klebsiella huaxiensis]VUS60524.1 hypothetical protein SB6425_00301 [Klebsiella huaxiensis]